VPLVAAASLLSTSFGGPLSLSGGLEAVKSALAAPPPPTPPSGSVEAVYLSGAGPAEEGAMSLESASTQLLLPNAPWRTVQARGPDAEQGRLAALSLGAPVPSPTPTFGPAPMAVPTAAPTVPAARRAAVMPLRYIVAEGDTLVKIANRFHVTPETVMWANDLGNGAPLRPGQELIVLPVSGVLHTVEAGDTLAQVASMYGAERSHVLEANLLEDEDELEEGRVLVVPGGMKRTIEPITGLPSAPSDQELARAPRYIVEPGDTLVSIADAWGVRPSVIQVANGLLNPDLLQIGQELAIPGGTRPVATPTPARPSPSPTAAPAGTAVPAPTATPTPTPVATAAPVVTATAPAPTPTPTPAPSPILPQPGDGEMIVYVVKRGDTLFSIARTFGVTVSSIQEANGIEDPSQIKVGQELMIPGGRTPVGTLVPAIQPSPTPTLPEPTSTPAPTATPEPTPTPTPTPVPPTAAPTPEPPPPPAEPVTDPHPPAEPPPPGSRGDHIAAIAQEFLGYRYLWGGHSPLGFDCSGFTWYVYRQAGVAIPLHDLVGQMNAGPRIERGDLLPGDLIFWSNTYTAGLSHAGIYLGGDRFISAETEATGVQIRSMSDPYWAARYTAASRPW
jgi:cell wall-associated NlpC family hydrolase